MTARARRRARTQGALRRSEILAGECPPDLKMWAASRRPPSSHCSQLLSMQVERLPSPEQKGAGQELFLLLPNLKAVILDALL